MEPVWSRFLDGWQRGQSHIDRLFGGVQGPPVVVVGLAFGNTMQPRDNFELGTGPVLKIESPRARYWRTMCYAVYTGQGMVSGDVYGDRFEADAPLPMPFGATEAREEIEQRITVLANQSNLVFGSDCAGQGGCPDAGRVARDPGRPGRGAACDDAPQGPAVHGRPRRRPSRLRISFGRPGRSTRRASRSTSSCRPTVAGPVRQLAAEATTAAARTPYDKALAIEALLRSLPYETKVPTPPSDRDWVDYTLFDVQTGYADSLATSMVVMLRTVGVPARVVTGFAPGHVPSRTRPPTSSSRARPTPGSKSSSRGSAGSTSSRACCAICRSARPRRPRSSCRSRTGDASARAPTCTWTTRTSTASATSCRARAARNDEAVADRPRRRLRTAGRWRSSRPGSR